MKKYRYIVVSDTHFLHDNIVKYCKRPELHSQIIFDNLLSKLSDNTILIHLGDICCGLDQKVHKEYINPLPGKKILVKGNHDKKSNNWYLNNGWDFVCDLFSIELFGKKIVFTHKPIVCDGEWEVNIHGHLHNPSRDRSWLKSWHFLVALEQNKYEPYLLEKIIQSLKY